MPYQTNSNESYPIHLRRATNSPIYRITEEPTFTYSATDGVGWEPKRYTYTFDPENPSHYKRSFGDYNIRNFNSEQEMDNAYKNGSYSLPVFTMTDDNGKEIYYYVNGQRSKAASPAVSASATYSPQRPQVYWDDEVPTSANGGKLNYLNLFK